jgi:hypothetical protein
MSNTSQIILSKTSLTHLGNDPWVVDHLLLPPHHRRVVHTCRYYYHHHHHYDNHEDIDHDLDETTKNSGPYLAA